MQITDVHNLNYTPITLGVRSWKYIGGLREKERFNSTGLDNSAAAFWNQYAPIGAVVLPCWKYAKQKSRVKKFLRLCGHAVSHGSMQCFAVIPGTDGPRLQTASVSGTVSIKLHVTDQWNVFIYCGQRGHSGARGSVVVKAYVISRKIAGSKPDEVN
jgi:hypothetical protein